MLVAATATMQCCDVETHVTWCLWLVIGIVVKFTPSAHVAARYLGFWSNGRDYVCTRDRFISFRLLTLEIPGSGARCLIQKFLIRLLGSTDYKNKSVPEAMGNMFNVEVYLGAPPQVVLIP